MSGMLSPLACRRPPRSPKGASPVMSSKTVAPNEYTSLALIGVLSLLKRSGPI